MSSAAVPPAHFSRAYRSWAGKAPTEERRRTQGGIVPALR